MTDRQLADRVVLVTGSAGGIGSAILSAAHAAGAIAIGMDIDPHADGTAAWTATADLLDGDAIADVVETVSRTHGRLDGLVNAAAISPRAPVENIHMKLWHDVVQTNLWAPIRLIGRVQPLMTPGSTIVNITSVRASRGHTDDAAYTATKGGLESATRALAVELAPAGIRVNAVAPGAVPTQMNRTALDDQKVRAATLARIPLGVLGRPGDIADAAIFLSSTAASWITGAVLPVDGGQSALG